MSPFHFHSELPKKLFLSCRDVMVPVVPSDSHAAIEILLYDDRMYDTENTPSSASCSLDSKLLLFLI